MKSFPLRRAVIRPFVAITLCSAGAAFAIVSLVVPSRFERPSQAAAAREIEPALNVRSLLASRARSTAGTRVLVPVVPANVPPAPSTPTFAQPVISGIGGLGFEESIRVDPSNPNRIYTSAPGTASADTSWIWRSLDAGRTFKWVPNALSYEGKVTTCHGGGDTELAVDNQGRLYFNDLTLANFSTARSDDFGTSFLCNNTGVPDVVVDRQWYALDGDPLNGGTLYLTNDEVAQSPAACGTTPGNNVLVVYRSPVAGANPVSQTAGIQFGPPNRITGESGCNEGIMGNIEVSPVATTLGQPDGLGGYAILPTPVNHAFVVHDDAPLHQVRVARCFPVAFGAPLANVSDPSGTNCTDILVKDLGPNIKTGGDFPTIAVDKAGNVYTVWEQAPIDANGRIIGDTVLMYSYSTDQGNSWATPIQIDTSGSDAGVLHNNVFAWIAAGDDGRVDIVWYGTPGLSNPNDQTCGQNAPLPPAQGSNINGPDSVDGLWSLWMVQSVNAHAGAPTFTAPVLASGHHIHRGSVQTLLGGQCGNRSLGDFLQMRIGAEGEANISYADSNNLIGAVGGHAMYVRQNGGNGLLSSSNAAASGLNPFNSISDPSGDARLEAGGVSSTSMPQLDILSSAITRVTSAPCSPAAPCYKVSMQINDLSLAPTTAQDPDPDLVWLTQWFVPSNTDPNGGKNFHVYAEAYSDGVNPPALQCFVGENAVHLVGGGATMTYPGNTQLPGANCVSTLGPNGNITIYVPISQVTEPGAVDARLHEVTASTMTLPQRANTAPSIGGIGGVLFNLIDVTPAYTVDTSMIGAASRKVHGGTTAYDVDLTPPAAGIECRSGGTSNNYQVVFKFAAAPSSVAGATVTPIAGGTAQVSGAPVIQGTEVLVNLTNVSNAQTLTVNLYGVTIGPATANFAATMSVLIGDTNADGLVNSADISQTKSQSGQVLGQTNFREDLNTDGNINSADISLVKSESGTGLPPN